MDVLLAMPRPLQFGRILPMLASMGVGTIWVTGGRRVEKAYFSSHLLSVGNEHLLRKALVEGLAQSGDTAVPRVVLCRNLPKVLREHAGSASGRKTIRTVRLACHPERIVPLRPEFASGTDGASSPSMPCTGRAPSISEVLADTPAGARVIVAIGPERGWAEPEELQLLASHGFQMVTLGPRTLRTDVAAVALLAVVNECLGRGAADE